jgi:plastocyanin
MSNGENSEHRVIEIIFAEVKDKVKSFVEPGHVCVSGGETVTFKVSHSEATIIFPDKNLLDPESQEKLTQERFLVINAKESTDVTIQEGIHGEYSYAVITTVNNDLASGGSFPTFIVE